MLVAQSPRKKNDAKNDIEKKKKNDIELFSSVYTQDYSILSIARPKLRFQLHFSYRFNMIQKSIFLCVYEHSKQFRSRNGTIDPVIELLVNF